MEIGGIAGVLYRVSGWIVRLAIVNLLWILFSLIGLLVFGFLPATAAMFAIIRRWKRGETELAVFQTFWIYYKADFIKVNGLGLILLIFGFTLYANMTFLQASQIAVLEVLYVPLLVITLFYGFMLLYVFPVYVHYDVNLLQVIKNSFLMMVLNPISTLYMVIGCVLIYIIVGFVPSLIPFFGGSSLAFLIMWSANRAFEKTQEKQEKVVEVKE